MENIDDPIAYSEQMTLLLLTRAQAFERRYVMRADCDYLGIIKPDEGEDFPIQFADFASILEFINETEPRTVEIVGSGEEQLAMEAALTRGAADTLQ